MTTHHTQRSPGRAVDPQHLEMLGKRAASLSEAGAVSLTEAVVQTVGHEKLNSEQVRRVVEHANVEAFNKKFAGLDGTFRAVHIDGGPADPAQVLQDLNDGARPREVIIDTLEYSMPPEYGMKVSSFVHEERTPKGVLGEIGGLHRKLSAAYDEVIQNAEAARGTLNEALEDLAVQVKRASLQGASAQEILEAWNSVDSEMAKTAYARTRRFMDLDAVKVAGRSLRPTSAVVETFSEFSKAARSYAAHSEALTRIEDELSRVEDWISHNGG